MIAVTTDTVDKNQVAQPQTYNIQRIALFTTTLGIISTVFVFFSLVYSPKNLRKFYTQIGLLAAYSLIYYSSSFFALAGQSGTLASRLQQCLV